MNKARRIRLREVDKMLSESIRIIEHINDLEQDSIDNTPENLQNTERYERMEDIVDQLNEAVDYIGQAKDNLQEAIR